MITAEDFYRYNLEVAAGRLLETLAAGDERLLAFDVGLVQTRLNDFKELGEAAVRMPSSLQQSAQGLVDALKEKNPTKVRVQSGELQALLRPRPSAPSMRGRNQKQVALTERLEARLQEQAARRATKIARARKAERKLPGKGAAGVEMSTGREI
jgi:hypothetical protein